jgi:predicted nucleotidyltransferase
MRAIQDPAEAAKFASLVIRRHLPDPAYRIFLFGSRASGSAVERSDIDIGIEGPAPLPHAALAAIQDELEEAPTLLRSMSSISGVCRRNFAKSRNNASNCDKISIAASRFHARRHASGRGSRPPQGSDRPRFSGSRFRLSYAGNSSRPISKSSTTPSAPHPGPVFARHSGTGSSTTIRSGSI